MRYLTLLAAGVMILTLCGTAGATLVSVGDPVEGGSWRQRFQEDGVGLFNHMQAKITSADKWETPGFRNPSVTGWTSTNNDTILVMNGPAVNVMQFDFYWKDPSPVTFVFQAWGLRNNVETLLEEATATNNPGYWLITGTSSGWQYQQPIPEPLTLLVVGSAVAGIGAYIRKRRLALA